MPPETSNNSSSNSKIGWIIVVIIIIIGIIWFLMSGAPKSDTNELAVGETGTAQDQGKSLKDLLAVGETQTCTFDNSTEVSESSGTIYVSGGMMRGDFESVSKPTNVKVATHMIMTDGTNYVWTSESDQGFKMSLDSVAGTGAATAQTGNYSAVDYDQKMGYNCTSWRADQSVFALPKGVSFMDMSDVMKGVTVPSGMPSIPNPPGVPNSY